MAIKAELDEKSFYEKAREESGNSIGKALFARLAKEEDFHAAKAEEIGEFLKRGENPLAIEESFDRGLRIGTIFARASLEDSHDSETELGGIELALKIEEKSRRLYEDLSDLASTDSEKRFFKALIQEEQVHYNALIRYKQFLLDSY